MKKFLKVSFTIVLMIWLCLNKNVKTTVGFCATDIVNSPKLKGENERIGINNGSTANESSITGNATYMNVDFDGDKVNLKFSDIPQVGELLKFKNKYFAVLIDSVKGPVDHKLIIKEGEYGVCSFNIPKEFSYLDVHVYGQDENDPDFLLREENFLCKAKFLSSYGTFSYLKKQDNCVFYYDQDGELNERQKPTIYQSIIPNFFIIGPLERAPLNYNFFAVLDLPNGKNDEVQYEDRVFMSSLVNPSFNDSQGANNALTKRGKYLYFKVSEDVNDVSLKLYTASTLVCDTGDDGYIGEFKIKLNRKNE